MVQRYRGVPSHESLADGQVATMDLYRGFASGCTFGAAAADLVFDSVSALSMGQIWTTVRNDGPDRLELWVKCRPTPPTRA